MTTVPVRRTPSPAAVVALQYANPARLTVVPAIVIGAVVVGMVVVTIAVRRAGGDPDTDWWGTFLWSTTGYVVAMGVQIVSGMFPLALALGCTRRGFVLGAFATAALEAAGLAVVCLVLLGVERATGGWFVGTTVFGDRSLGAGDPVVLTVTVFLLMLVAMTVGGVFSAAYVRAGAAGPLALGLVIALIAAVALLLFLPAIVALLSDLRPWWLAVGAVALTALGLAGQALLLRGASVR